MKTAIDILQAGYESAIEHATEAMALHRISNDICVSCLLDEKRKAHLLCKITQRFTDWNLPNCVAGRRG